MKATPRRIVSLVPSSTESIVALGSGAALVGCTRYCTEPADGLAPVARIGGTKNPSRDAIARLDPDLVVANGEENRSEDIDWLAARTEVLVQTPRTVGAVNVCGDAAARYPEVSLDRVVAAGVDAVLLPSEPWEFGPDDRERMLAERTFGAAAVALCDGRDFCWHGVRMADGLGRALELVRHLAGQR